MTCNCANCGAPLVAVEGRLHMRCEHCASLWFPPESDEGVRTAEELVGYDCPVCATPLVDGSIENSPVAFCPNCHGILATSRELYQIISVRRRRAEAPFAAERAVGRTGLARLLACPSCRQAMSAHPYYGPGNAILDTCGECLLVWLDHSELTVIRSARA